MPQLGSWLSHGAGASPTIVPTLHDTLAMQLWLWQMFWLCPTELQRKQQGQGRDLSYLQGGKGSCLQRGKCQGMVAWQTGLNSSRHC